jgi:hypothetical protein
MSGRYIPYEKKLEQSELCMSTNKSFVAQWLARGAQGVFLLAIAGCAQMAATALVTIPPIPAGESRIWFYRAADIYTGKGLPAIAANGGYVGQAELGGAFYRDVPPGHYLVTVQTVGVDVNQSANFDLASGHEAYVKIVSLPSWDTGGDRNEWERPTFYAWLIPNQVAQADVAHLSFYGGS